jgi:hypothetical protein
MAEKKHRCYLRHHLYDAIVLSHIPPGVGMNFKSTGGIFQLSKDKKGNPVLSAIEGLLPDLEAFEQANAQNCLVHKHRSKKSKQSRAEQTIYSKFTKSNGDSSVTLKVRKPLTQQVLGKDAFVPAKDAEKWIKDSGIPLDKLPPKLVEKWKESNGSKPLKLVDGTPVESVPVSTTSEQITSLFPHRNHAGEIIGLKTTTEAYASCQIWEGPKRSKDGSAVLDAKGQPVLDYIRVLVPPARNLASYKKQFGTDWKPDVVVPRDFSKVGQIKKGLIIRIPFDSAGIINTETPNPDLYRICRVVCIKSNGQIGLTLAEFISAEMKDSPWEHLAKYQETISKAKTIANIAKINNLT